MTDLDYRVFDAASDLASAVKTLRSEQCIQVRNALPAEIVADTASRAIDVFARGSGDEFDEKFQVANVRLIDPTPLRLSYPVLRAIYASKIWDIASAFLETRSIYILVSITYARKVSADRTDIAIPYHQDGLGLPAGPDYRMLSVWMLLSPESCGSRAPGLEFLAGGPSRMLEFEQFPVNENFRNTQSADRDIAELERSGAVAWRPEMAAGDAMLFSQWNPHRAFITGDHKVPRYSLETRLVAKNAATDELFRQRGTSVIDVDRGIVLGPRSTGDGMEPLGW